MVIIFGQIVAIFPICQYMFQPDPKLGTDLLFIMENVLDIMGGFVGMLIMIFGFNKC